MSFLFVLALVNTWERDRAYFYHFFGLNKIIRKRNPPRVLFKLFSDSLNMKRSSSDLAIFTLDKVSEVSFWWAIIYLFFGLIQTILRKKALREFSFKCFFKLYNLEKPLSFLSLDSLNKHCQTRNGTEPLLLRVR